MTAWRKAFCLVCFGWGVLATSSTWGVGVNIDVDLVEGEGYVEADLGPGPHLVDVPVGVRHGVSIVFNRFVNRVIPRLGFEATVDVEFTIDNTSNPHDLSYDIGGRYGILHHDHPDFLSITAGTIAAGELKSLNLPLQALTNGDLTGMSFSVDTMFLGGAGEGTFDLRIGGGGGDPDRVATGPIRWAPAHLVGPQPGDVDWNGDVDLQDLFNVQNNFGMPSPPYTGDSDGDGDIDLQDLFDVQNSFGQSGAVASAGMITSVPEPSGLIFCVVALGALCGWQRHRPFLRYPR